MKSESGFSLAIERRGQGNLDKIQKKAFFLSPFLVPYTAYTAYTLYTALVLTQCYTGLYITLWSEQAL